jgi:hypothetical protein
VIQFDVSFEKQVRDYLLESKLQFRDNSTHAHKVDFSFLFPTGEKFNLELKEKRQPTNTITWPTVSIPSRYIFIIDDLSCRKIFNSGTNSGVAVRDMVTESYYFADVLTLFMMPRVRVNRALDQAGDILKGKWMVDLRNFFEVKAVGGIFACAYDYVANHNTIYRDTPSCFGDFYGETIGMGGGVRTKAHKQYDYAVTR